MHILNIWLMDKEGGGRWTIFYGLGLNLIILLMIPGIRCFAAEIAIIKSNNVTPYNQAIEGFIREIKTGVREYDLQGKPDRASEIVEEIRRFSPRLIFTLGSLAGLKAKENFPHLPVIYTLVLTPEGKELSGGNMTGISIEVNSLEQLLTLKKIVPEVQKIGVLYSYLTEQLVSEAKEICRDLGLELIAYKLRRPEEVPDRIKMLLPKVDAMWLIPDSIVVNQDSLHHLLMLTLENDIPFMVYNKNFAKAGALLAPVVDYGRIGQQAGRLAKAALQGRELPVTVLPPEGVEWAINLRVAQNLKLQISAEVLTLFKHVYK